MKTLIDSQRLYFNSNVTKSIDFRIQQLDKLLRLLRKNEKRLNEAIYNDFKKSSFDNYTNELALIYHEIKEAKRKVKRWSRVKRVKTNIVNQPGRSYIVPEPLGVCLVIGAWNYPYQLSLAPMVAAMAAGNTVVLKPSELPIETSTLMARLINENFTSNYITVVEGGVTETTALLSYRFDKIFFTGSVPVGKIVYQAAARHLTPVTLELGGKSPAFITDTCKLDITVKRLVWSKFLNAGQTCIAPDYVLVDESIKEVFLNKLEAEIVNANFSIGNGNYTQIINKKNILRLVAMLADSKVRCGGEYSIEERYMAPTVLSGVGFEDKVMEEEIFGPILPVVSYTNLDDAVDYVKSKPKPLSCYVFTGDKKVKNRVLKDVSFGGGVINDAVMHVANSNLPFGGVGDSGMGAYHGEYGFRTFSHYKAVLERATLFELELKHFPHTERKFKIIKWIMNL